MPEKLSEHEQAPTNEQTVATVQQSQEKEDLFLQMRKLKDEGKKNKEKPFKNAEKAVNFYEGRQWGANRARYRSQATLNVCRSTVQTMLPILTDTNPGFNVGPQDPTDFDFAELVGAVSESWWDKAQMQHEMIETLTDEMVLPGGIQKVIWDADADDGAGDIKVFTVDPRDIFLPCAATDFNKDCPWVIHRVYKTVAELKAKFPDMAEFIKPDNVQEKEDQKTTTENGDVELVSPVDIKDPQHPVGGASGGGIDGTAEIWECWVDDSTLEYLDELDEDGEKKAKKKYPRGKLVTCLVSQKLILQEEQNPYVLGDKWPFVRYVDTIKPREFWGEGEVEPLISTQEQINKTLANMMDYMNFTSNPVWFVPKESGTDVDRITNQYGLIISYGGGPNNKPNRDIPPPLPAYMLQLYQLLGQAAETVSGIQDVTQGRKPAGVTAAQAIETLQEAAQTRIRLKERNLNTSLSQLGRLIIARILQFYREPRIFKINGREGWPEYIEFHIEEDAGGKFVPFKREYIKTDDGKFVRGDVVQGAPSKGLFDVKVISGSSLPFQKSQRSNLLLRLFENQSIDQEALLKGLEIDKAEEIIERMQGAAEQQALAAQQEGVQ